MIKYVFRCEVAFDFTIQKEIEEDDYNLLICKCKKTGIAHKITHKLDNDMKGNFEEYWMIEPYATDSYGEMITKIILA